MPNRSQVHFELPDDAECLKCRYRLKNLSQPQCPECGQSFEPGDQWSYWQSSRSSRLARFGMQGPGWLLCVLITFFILILLYGASVPGGYFLPQMVGVLGLVISGSCWGLRVAMWFNYLGRMSKSDRPKRLRIRLTVPFAVFVLGMVLLFANATERLRFAIARPAMTQLANQIQSGKQNQPLLWFDIGGTKVSEARTIGRSGTLFLVGNTGFLMIAPGGWAYLPDKADQAEALSKQLSPNSDFDGYDFEHFTGDWYRFDN